MKNRVLPFVCALCLATGASAQTAPDPIVVEQDGTVRIHGDAFVVSSDGTVSIHGNTLEILANGTVSINGNALKVLPNKRVQINTIQIRRFRNATMIESIAGKGPYLTWFDDGTFTLRKGKNQADSDDVIWMNPEGSLQLGPVGNQQTYKPSQ